MPSPIADGSRTILIVEDDRAMRALLSSTLSSAGYQVRLASDGAEGLDLLKQHAPALVLLDLQMPRMSGAAFRAVQQRLAAPLSSIPVIVVSGKASAAEEGARLGAVACITKPFLPATLLQTVEAHACAPVPAA
jgi:CheY-like chemotaxis protein